MATLADRRALVGAAWRTWGARGLLRRTTYELAKRSGSLRRAEDGWPAAPPGGARLRPLQLNPQPAPQPAPRGISLYGGLELDVAVPPDWHRHPLTGHRFDATAHWSELSDADASAGDIKDLWELGRFGWLQARLPTETGPGSEAAAEETWSVIEDWYRENPRYRGPQWMCGQEASLRTISVMLAASTLDAFAATTDERRDLAAQLVHDAVGRVRPTLGYALSQRNNHATSEAGFLWSASVLAPWLPDAASLRDRAARALTEAVGDQFATDGSYAQHSPTYARVALHVLLWCLAVERATGVAAPAGVHAALVRGGAHLNRLLVAGSNGRIPNLGGNDGALVFDLAGADIGDFRPLLAHVAAATGEDLELPEGPWDREAAWFGLRSPAEPPHRPSPPSRSTHALAVSGVHLVVRAGALDHRPAHADQLHVDLWLDGVPVAVDPGSYRYTAPAPWANALAGEEVHNLVRRPGVPQATRAGRFFWSRWSEARVCSRVSQGPVAALEASLELVDGAELRRVVAVTDGVAVVVDTVAGPDDEVHWNLLGVESVSTAADVTTVLGGFEARMVHDGAVTVHEPDDDDPRSGWHAPTYGRREPLQALTVTAGAGERVLSAFASPSKRARLDEVVASLRALPPGAGAVEVASAIREQR